jgi:hypothetical protein
MPDFMVRWDGFSGGDFGEQDPARANDNQFKGTNVVVYQSGLVGPRAGLKNLTVTGLPDHPVAPGPMGFDVFEDNLLIVLDDVYSIPIDSPTAVAYTAYPSPAATPVRFVEGKGVLYSLLDGVLYKHVGTGTAAVTTPEPLSEIVRWGAWFVGVDAGVPWRLWFSLVDAGGSDFDTWPANNFLDVGANEAITAMKPIYNTLYVGKVGGWWSVSGVLGIQASVREVVIGNGPTDNRFTSVTTDNRIIYWPVESVPAWFNGDRVYLDDNQKLNVRDLPYTGNAVVVSPTSRRLFLAGDDDGATELLVWKDSAWTRHRYENGLGGFAPNDVRSGYQLPEGVIFAVRRPSIVGEDVVISSLDHDLNRPGHADDDWAAPTDGADTELVTGTLEMPAWYDGQGRMVRVRSVIVNFRKWPSGVAGTTNRLSVVVRGLGMYEGGDIEGEQQDWEQASDRVADTDGENHSLRVGAGAEGWFDGFQITFPVIRGVAIRSVVAVLDVRTERT